MGMFLRLTQLSVLLSLSLLGMGCTDAPRERLESAWLAAEDERFEDFVAHFSASSAPLIRGLAETKLRTKRAFTYIDSPYELAPRGDILEVEERDALIVVTIKADERYRLRMISEGGAWVIDGVALAALWAPLSSGEEL